MQTHFKKILIERSLEVKSPKVGTDGKARVGRVREREREREREEKKRSEKTREEKELEERRCRCAKR